MLYNLVNKIDGQIKDGHSNLTAVQLAELKINTSLYNLVEVENSSLKEKKLHELSEKEREVLLNAFKKTLSAGQLNEVATGIKEIRYSQNVGYHLRTLDKQEKEIYVSIEQQKSKRIEDINKLIKKSVISLESEIFSLVRMETDISMGEFAEIFKNYTK